jgi:hypothetical protein
MNSKYTIKTCSGYWVHEPTVLFHGVRIALEEWDGIEDHEDESVFYYMDNEPLQIGSVIAESFTVSHIEE